MTPLSQQQIQNQDPQQMWKLLVNFPQQWKEAMEISQKASFSFQKEEIQTICIAGMGGSAIGADLIRAYVYDHCPYPIQVVRHYNIPAWVDEHTLFVACSYSGNTEETLSALAQAREKGAQTVGVTSGGELLLQASKEDFDYVKIPGGLQPRAALGYSFVPLFRIFQHLGVIENGDKELDEAAGLLKQQGEAFANIKENEALSLAMDLIDTLPVIYSDATMMEPVNLRWRGQIEENAKTLAYGNTLPEMNHNEIVGWDQIVHLTGRLSVIMLNDEEDHSSVQQRMQIVGELIDDQVASRHVLSTRGKYRLTRMFSLIQLADWTSFYLAMLNGVDPTPVTKIDLLKSRLAEL